MKSKLIEAIELLKKLPEKGIEKALEQLREIKKGCEEEEKSEMRPCPYCHSGKVVRNGHKKGKQAYKCQDCGKSFVATTKTSIFGSHCGATVWMQVIEDTIDGVSLNETAEKLMLHHETVFNMRHKILFCLEQAELRNPVQLEGICEADETFVLESYKGKKLPSDYWRRPRRHGAVAEKRGLSSEYICICAGIERKGGAISRAVNRAVASKEDIVQALGEHVSEKTVVLSDGAKGYTALGENRKCTVIHVNPEGGDSCHVNTVNGFHSYIKERHREARGFATKYLNRYNALFSIAYRSTQNIADDIFRMLSTMDEQSYTIKQTQNLNLLQI
jgi:transposase-like protein